MRTGKQNNNKRNERERGEECRAGWMERWLAGWLPCLSCLLYTRALLESPSGRLSVQRTISRSSSPPPPSPGRHNNGGLFFLYIPHHHHHLRLLWPRPRPLLSPGLALIRCTHTHTHCKAVTLLLLLLRTIISCAASWDPPGLTW